jgi:prolyl-tRNA synthetase
MKDSYSFDKDQEGLDIQYARHYKSYFRIFSRCALPAIVVSADSGMMGGKISHEYMYLSSIGEDTIITCSECGYTANRQIASFKKTYHQEEAKPLEKVKTPDCKTIDELALFLKIEKSQTAKAVFMVGTFIDDENGDEEEKLIIGVIRGDLDVEENKLQNASKANALRPAHPEEIIAKKMVPGYGSPIGASEDVLVIVDDSVAKSNNLVAGANEEGYHLLNTNFERDYTGKVADLASAIAGAPCPHCSKPLTSSKGVEIGNIFQLGTRYSEAMNCYYQDESGVRRPVIMGSYGIGVGRLLACLAEEYADDKGLALPITVAPYQIHLVSLVKDAEVVEGIYKDLTSMGIEVLYDDRKDSAGVKFADADLIGLPIRITVGNRSLKEGKVEVKLRSNLDETLSYDLKGLAVEMKGLIQSLTDAINERIVEPEWDKTAN